MASSSNNLYNLKQDNYFENFESSIVQALFVVDKTSESVTSLFGGWRPELLIDTLSVREKKLLIGSTCHGVMRDAVFYGKDYTCKVCLNLDVLDSAFVNYNTRCIINELQIKCPLTEEGCDWTGAIETITKHFLSCLYYPVPCPLECTVIDNNITEPVITTLPRHDVESHVTETCPNRQINCNYCNKPFKSVEINFHVSGCSYFPLACPNNCINPHNNETTLVERGGMNNHIEMECANVEIDCPYLPHGCTVKLLRKDLATHEQDSMSQHLSLINSVVDNKLLEKNIEILRSKTKVADDYTISAKLIQNFNSVLNKEREESNIESELKYNLINDEFNAKLTAKFESLEISFQAQLEEKFDSIETLLNNKFKEENIFSTLQNQLAKFDHKITKQKEDISKLNKIITIILPANCYEWTIKSVKNHIRNKSDIFSEYFNVWQYRFIYQVQFNDDTLAIYAYICKSDIDDLLMWPFSACYTFTLVNQDNPLGHHTVKVKATSCKRPTINRCKGCDKKEFIKICDLYNDDNYCKNDCIILRFSLTIN